MDILFRQTYNYNLSGSYDQTKKRLEENLSNPLFDFSKRYIGSISEDGTFKFKQKLFTFLLPIDFVYLEGKLTKNENASKISITLTPKIILVLIIYGSLLIWLISLFNNSPLFENGNKVVDFIGIFGFDLFIFIPIFIRGYFLRKSFEKAIIKRDYSSFDNSFTNIHSDK